MKSYILQFKWTVSKGKTTYGYNICSLYVDGKKQASCNGGGYDMVGTVLGNYIEKVYQDRLLQIKDQAQCRGEKDGGKLYGMHNSEVENHVDLDGACGQESIERIMQEIGLVLACKDYKNGLYLLTDARGEVKENVL